MLEDTFADIVGKARYGRGWSISDLAQHSDLPPPRLEALETGSEPTEKEVGLVALPLKLDAEKLAAIAQNRWNPAPVRTEWPEWSIQVIDGRIGNYPVNGYLAIDPARKEGVLFDTGCSPNRVTRLLAEWGIRLVALCITHAHPDHIGGADRIQSATGAPIYLHPNELAGGKKAPELLLLKEGLAISAARFEIHPLYTPGHTPGGTTFLIRPDSHSSAPIAFAGDALFAGSVGRAYSPSTYSVLLHSVQNEILSLPEETLLLPGHGPATTVGEERAHNPFF